MDQLEKAVSESELDLVSRLRTYIEDLEMDVDGLIEELEALRQENDRLDRIIEAYEECDRDEAKAYGSFALANAYTEAGRVLRVNMTKP